MLIKPNPMLEVKNLVVAYHPGGGSVLARIDTLAVQDISFSVNPGESLAIVGESGSGKTSILMAVLGFVQPDAGTIYFMGKDIGKLGSTEMTELRHCIQPVFQDSGASLNPRMTIGSILHEVLRVFNVGDSRQEFIRELLTQVGLEENVLARYPRQLSGGQKQRVNLVRALIGRPKLIILDEPFATQDISNQANLVNLLLNLRKNYTLNYLIISHDLSVIAPLADRILVIKSGKFVEEGSVMEVLHHSANEYTKTLFAAG
jgi:ABC-type glutathione transport system ATPase component